MLKAIKKADFLLAKILENTFKHLQKVERAGLMKSIENGFFADMPRKETDGKGLEGVIQKERGYFNPVFDELKEGKYD